MLMLPPLIFVRVGDEIVEHSAVLPEIDGTVIISAAHYKSLMKDAGWTQR